MVRIAQCAFAIAALTTSVAFAQPGAAEKPDEQQKEQEARRTPPPLPVITERQIGINPPVNPEVAFGPSAPPPLADPIPVRKNFAPELAQAGDEVGDAF